MKLIPESARDQRADSFGTSETAQPSGDRLRLQSRTISAVPRAGCFGVTFTFTRALA